MGNMASIPIKLLLTTIALVITINANAVMINIDMTDVGGGSGGPAIPFNQNHFAADGVVFTLGSLLQWTQGDDSLLFENSGPSGLNQPGIQGTFTKSSIKRISVDVAPRLQGIYEFNLYALDSNLNVVASRSQLVNQILGDPGFDGWGYTKLTVAGFGGAKITNFMINANYLSGPFIGPGVQHNAAGLSSLSFTVPEPSTFALVSIGLPGLIGISRRKKA